MNSSRNGEMANLARAAVVYANNYQCGPAQRIRNGPVQSRMLLWCQTGRGQCIVNTHAYDMTAGQYLMLPWEHSIEYRADRNEPFLLGGLHIVPWLRWTPEMTYGVAHNRDSPLWNLPTRRDLAWPFLTGVTGGSLLTNRGLASLARACVQRFLDGPPEPWECRAFARLILAALRRSTSPDVSPLPMPPALQQAVQYVLNHRDQTITLDDLAAVAGGSASSVQRLFRQHLGCPPLEWVHRYRFRMACEMLRTTRQPIAAVGQALGFTNPYYFSRWFHQRAGQTASAYRREVMQW